MRIAIASCSVMPDEFQDDHTLAAELTALGADVVIEPWDTPGFGWDAQDAIVIRSTWDYSFRHHEFLSWLDEVAPALHNCAPLVAWNSDKRYLADLGAAGLPVVETTFLAGGAELEADGRELIVKPNISAGARDTGRFRAELFDDAAALADAIQASGRVAMVQPFIPTVDESGETALVFFDGEFSHALRKRAVLRPDEVAPIRDDGIKAAEVMYTDDLVLGAEARADQLELARAVLAEVERRFEYRPLYARVDMLDDEAGAPILLELEAVEPNLYFGQAEGAAARLARAIVDRA